MTTLAVVDDADYEFKSPEHYAQLAETLLNEGGAKEGLVYATLAQASATMRLVHASGHRGAA